MLTVKCYQCGYVATLGEPYYVWDDHDFCSMECAQEYIMDQVHVLERHVGEDDRF